MGVYTWLITHIGKGHGSRRDSLSPDEIKLWQIRQELAALHIKEEIQYQQKLIDKLKEKLKE